MEISRFSYYWLDTWVLANVIQLATQDFCIRYLNRTNDPCGRQFDQMTMAARSAPANIAEGSSRHSTSLETEMKLTDVARATLAELANDYQNWLLRMKEFLGLFIPRNIRPFVVYNLIVLTTKMMYCIKAVSIFSHKSISSINGL